MIVYLHVFQFIELLKDRFLLTIARIDTHIYVYLCRIGIFCARLKIILVKFIVDVVVCGKFIVDVVPLNASFQTIFSMP